ETDQLEREVAHLGDVRREVAPLGDHPAVALPLDGEARFRLDDLYRGDVRDLEVLEERLAERGDVVGPLVALAVAVEERTAAEDGEQHDQHQYDTSVHAAALLADWRRRRMSATPMPKSATR